LPPTLPFLGVSTYAAMMIFLLGVSLLFTLLGGQVTVMITDFAQGMFVNVTLLAILAAIFWLFDCRRSSRPSNRPRPMLRACIRITRRKSTGSTCGTSSSR